jgi:hypothetical protein
MGKERPDGYPATPELERMRSITDLSHRIGEFIDWLHETKFWICERHEHQGSDDSDAPSGCWEKHTCTATCFCNGPHPHDPEIRGSKCTCRQEMTLLCGRHEGEYYTTNKTPEKLLALFFKIDLNKVEKERQAILDWMAKKNEKIPR